MKMITTILIVLAIIIAIPFTVALFVKNEYSIQREITINRPRKDVFDYIKLQKNQAFYSKWVMTDPDAKKQFTGIDGTVGFIYAWDSENKQSGKGEQEIMKINDGQSIELEIRFERPFKGVGYPSMSTDSLAADQTKVQWRMSGRNKYPFNLMNLLMMDVLGKDLEISLLNLKTILEK